MYGYCLQLLTVELSFKSPYVSKLISITSQILVYFLIITINSYEQYSLFGLCNIPQNLSYQKDYILYSLTVHIWNLKSQLALPKCLH